MFQEAGNRQPLSFPMTKIQIKPLSVNDCWQGKRFKTPAYKAYETELLCRLPKITLPQPPYKLSLSFGFSNKLSDLDNPVKAFTDVMQKKYGFNDRDIFELHVVKQIVPRGSEFVEFTLMPFSLSATQTHSANSDTSIRA
jgi:hypothetical protein